MGHRVIREALESFKADSKVHELEAHTVTGGSSNDWTYTPFNAQPTGRSYALKVKMKFEGKASATDFPRVGVRVLASENEYTDIFYDLGAELFNVSRLHSSLIPSYNNNTCVSHFAASPSPFTDSGRSDFGPLRLWHIKGANGASTREALNLFIIVDNSIVEVYVNDHFAITSRVYPWLAASVGAGFIHQGGASSASVRIEGVELWDGLSESCMTFLLYDVDVDACLADAWPERPKNTSLPLIYDGPLVPWTGS